MRDGALLPELLQMRRIGQIVVGLYDRSVSNSRFGMGGWAAGCTLLHKGGRCQCCTKTFCASYGSFNKKEEATFLVLALEGKNHEGFLNRPSWFDASRSH